MIRVATAVPEVRVGDVDYNVAKIKELIEKAKKEDIDIVVFPELAITGYTCGDLFLTSSLRNKVMPAIKEIQKSIPNGLLVIVGAPIIQKGKLYNSAVLLTNEKILIENKVFLPNYKEFYEQRWFSEGKLEDKKVYQFKGVTFGVEICEDVWAPEPPSTYLVKKGAAQIIFNLSASNELVGKHDYLVSLLKQQSARLISGYVYASAGFGESSTDLVYAGNGIIIENGKILEESPRFTLQDQLTVADIDVEALDNERAVNKTFQRFLDTEKSVFIEIPGGEHKEKKDLRRKVNPFPFKADATRYKEIFNIQVTALAKRLQHTGMKPVIGVSGGSDSTWALVIAVEACRKLGRPTTDVLGVSMPGFATSERTRKNAKALSEEMGITFKEIDITSICKAELEALSHPLDIQDITYENVQARTRTQILMNLANQEGGLVIGTGDLSELALGWCTYNADHMSMYGVNASVPKTLVKELIAWYSDSPVFKNILSTPVSPELTGTGAEGDNPQVTEDNIGPYEVHDFVLYHFLRHGFGPEKIKFLAEHTVLKKYDLDKWIAVFFKRFTQQQFKRSCLPDGPKIGSVSLSPRGDWRMPSDSSTELWQ